MIKDLIHMKDYDRWANEKILDALENLDKPSEEPRKLFGHLMMTQELMLSRISEGSFGPFAEPFPLYPFPQVKNKWKALGEAWEGVLGSMTEERLETIIPYLGYWDQKPYRNTVGEIIWQAWFHSTYHRGQLAQAIRRAGGEPPGTDYIFYSRQKH